jgi:hypothetical protein
MQVIRILPQPEIHCSHGEERESIENLIACANTFVGSGGSCIRCVMIDRNELKDAKVHSESHRDPIVYNLPQNRVPIRSSKHGAEGTM